MPDRAAILQSATFALGLFATAAPASSPPGVPKIDAAPPVAAPVDGESASEAATTPEAVAMFDLRRLPNATGEASELDPGEIALFLLSEAAGRDGVVERHGPWIVVRGAPSAVDAARRAHAGLRGATGSPARIEGVVLELDRSHPRTPDLLETLVVGSIDPETLARLEASPAVTVLGRPTFDDPTESESAAREPELADEFEITVAAPRLEGETGPYRIVFERARERTIGRRRDRSGMRFELDTALGVDAYSPLLARPFAEAEVRELDGGRRRIELAPPRNPPDPIAVLLRRRPIASDDAGTPGPVYRPMKATRDGIGIAYFDREIAQVMGHFAAGWLERPEREREERTDLLIEMLGLRPGMAVADIGAGSGYFTRRMSPRVGPGGLIYATDIQPEMLRILEDGLRREGIENVKPVLGRIDDTGLAPESVDLILLVDVYHEFDHPWEMSRSMHRALRPGGRVALVEYRAGDPNVPIKPLHTMTEAQARLEYEAAGFRLVDSRVDGLPWQRLMLFEKPAVRVEGDQPSAP